jgi:hypothetical protein
MLYLQCQAGLPIMAKKIPAKAGAEKQDVKLMVNYRLRASVLAAVAKAAKDDGRSATGMVEKVLSDWLKERGYLK